MSNTSNGNAAKDFMLSLCAAQPMGNPGELILDFNDWAISLGIWNELSAPQRYLSDLVDEGRLLEVTVFDTFTVVKGKKEPHCPTRGWVLPGQEQMIRDRFPKAFHIQFKTGAQ